MSNVKTYKHNDKTQLTKNINASELKCHGSGHTHDTLIDIEHINNIQKFMDANGFTKVIFSRGYSCPSHNKAVGGASGSYHTKGMATDQCFYKDGKVVPAKQVCCLAQDFGFKGIAYITSSYVHLDNRPSGTYRGDETKGYSNNVGGDFYKYFGISKGGDDKYNLTRLLKSGLKGDDVKKLQQELINRGYPVGSAKADGIFGNNTSNAVKKFQKDNGLTSDGKVGKDTAHKLGWLYQGK